MNNKHGMCSCQVRGLPIMTYAPKVGGGRGCQEIPPISVHKFCKQRGEGIKKNLKNCGRLTWKPPYVTCLGRPETECDFSSPFFSSPASLADSDLLTLPPFDPATNFPSAATDRTALFVELDRQICPRLSNFQAAVLMIFWDCL